MANIAAFIFAPALFIIIYALHCWVRVHESQVSERAAYELGLSDACRENRKEWVQTISLMAQKALADLVSKYDLEIKVVDEKHSNSINLNTGEIQTIGELVRLPKMCIRIHLDPRSVYFVREKSNT